MVFYERRIILKVSIDNECENKEQIMEETKMFQESSSYDEGNFTEEEKIILKIRSGDETAITDIKNRYGIMYINLMTKILQDKDEVSECENDFLLAIWNKIRAVEMHELPKNFSGYIWKTARNKAIDRYKSNKNRKKFITESINQDDIDYRDPHNIEDETLARIILQSIAHYVKNELSDEEYRLFTMRFVRCMDIDSIVKFTGLNINTVVSKLSRLKIKIKRHLIAEGYLNE